MAKPCRCEKAASTDLNPPRTKYPRIVRLWRVQKSRLAEALGNTYRCPECGAEYFQANVVE